MIQSVSRAIDVLHIVAAAGDWIGVREIARQLDLKPSTVQGLLKTLQTKGLLDFGHERRQYRLGFGALLLAAAVDPMKKLTDLSTPFINKLSEEFGETVVVMTFEGGHCVVVQSRASQHELTVKPPPNLLPVPNPADMATGRMLLAWLPKNERAKFALDAATIADIDKTRLQGYCWTENINNSGIAAVAVPVCAPSGQIVITVGCSAPLHRLTDCRRACMLEHLRAAACNMEHALSGTGDPCI